MEKSEEQLAQGPDAPLPNVENPPVAPNASSYPQPSSAPASLGAPGWGTTCILCLFISIASSAMSIWWYDCHYATKIVAVDLKGYIEKQAADFANGKITQEDSTKAILQIGEFVKNVPANTAVITADVAVRNVDVLKP